MPVFNLATPRAVQVDLLKLKLAREGQARRTLQRRLADERRRAEDAAAAQRGAYEARLAALQASLREAAAAASSPAARQRLSSGHPLEAAEVEALRKEVAEQDRLLRAYQVRKRQASTRAQRRRE